MSMLLFTVGAVLVVAGIAMVVRAWTGRGQIRDELSGQQIVFPDADDLPAGLVGFAGQQVRSGGQARAYSDLIAEHLNRATKGRTYSQLADAWQAGGRTDEKLAKLRETAFMGQTLRGSLLGAYQAWEITTLLLALGGLLGAIGVAFLALGASWQ